MSAPIVYVGKYRIVEGKLEEFRQVAKEIAAFVEANEPQLIAYNEYINEEGTEASGIQIHPDSASMETHLNVAGQAFGKAMELFEDVKIDLYGTPSAPLLERLNQMAQMFGVSLTVHEPQAGFSRLPKS